MSIQNSLESLSQAQETFLGSTPARERLAQFFDEGSFREIGGFVQRENEPVSLVCGYGNVQESPVFAFSQNGPLGLEHVQKMVKLYSLASKNGFPIVGFYDSNGLHLSDGVKILDAMSDLLAYQSRLSGVVPQISVILGPCIGSNAMLACTADYVVMSENAAFFSTPPTANVSDDVGSALSVSQAGIAHYSGKDDKEVLEAAKKLLTLLPSNNITPLPFSPHNTTGGNPAALSTIAATHEQDTQKLVQSIIDTQSGIELYSKFGTGVVGVMATLEGSPVGVIATTGGKLTGDDCVKIARLVSVWDSFNIPVLTLVNSTGMAQLGAASARDMAKISQVYAAATVEKIAVITGAAYSASYIALASRGTGTDMTFAWPNAVISPLEPSTAVAFLEGGQISKDKPRSVLEAEYKAGKGSALRAAKEGLIDSVIFPENTRESIVEALDLLAYKRVENLPRKHGNIPF